MSNLRITSTSPYARSFNNITVTGTANSGVIVKVMIIVRQTPPISTETAFNNKYNSVTTKNQTVATSQSTDEGTPPPQGSATWSVQVPVTGLTAGTEYVIYASDGAGKFEMQDPAKFSGT